MFQKALLSLLFSLSLHTVFSQSFNKEKLDSYFQGLEKSDKFMGSVALFKNGKVVYTKAIGFADIDTKKQANEATQYRIGSISKSFTAVLVLKAIEEKKLKIETKLSDFYPAIKNAEKITISNLLNHRSGIHNFTADSTYLTWNTKKHTEEELVKMITSGGSDFEPNTAAEYSNSNFVLLTYILQKVYAKTYAELVNTKIVKPLALKNTFVGDKIDLQKNECYSYAYKKNWIKETETDMSIPMGAGAVVSTPTDLGIFALALFKGKIISTKSLKLMTTITDGYGLGVFELPFNNKISFGHTGAIDGFSSMFGCFPKDKIAFALISNGSRYNNNAIAIVLLSAVFNLPYDIPDFIGYQVSTEDLDQYLGTYSSADFPLKITITKDDVTLMAQATGQSEFGLDAVEKDKFKFDPAGIKLEFNPKEKTMLLKQGIGKYLLTKE